MTFDFEEWKTAIFAMAQGMIKANDLLKASGLIDADPLDEEAFDLIVRQIEEDIAGEERRSGKASPGRSPG